MHGSGCHHTKGGSHKCHNLCPAAAGLNTGGLSWAGRGCRAGKAAALRRLHPKGTVHRAAGGAQLARVLPTSAAAATAGAPAAAGGDAPPAQQRVGCLLLQAPRRQRGRVRAGGRQVEGAREVAPLLQLPQRVASNHEPVHQLQSKAICG